MQQLVPEHPQKPDFHHYVEKEELQNGFGTGWMTEKNRKIGKWKLTYEDRIEEGEFLNGKKINEWLIMNKITNVIEKGYYDNHNLRTGDWISYIPGNTESQLRITYLNGIEISRKKIDTCLISTIHLKQK